MVKTNPIYSQVAIGSSYTPAGADQTDIAVSVISDTPLCYSLTRSQYFTMDDLRPGECFKIFNDSTHGIYIKNDNV